MKKEIAKIKTESRGGPLAKIDFNGAFIYYPKGIKLSGKVHFLVEHGYLINQGTINDAVKKLKSKNYKDWLGKFKKLK